MRKKSLSVKKKSHKYSTVISSDRRINKIFNLFEDNLKKIVNINKYAAAISGGPDSMALAYLIKRHNFINNKKCYFYHVDHKLRKNSYREATKIKKILKKWNINLKIISWFGTKPIKQIQSISRANRYNLLKKEMKKKNIKYLLLGHNENDVVENFFIRINRGSGLKGFVSLNQIEVKRENIYLIRPLINISKDDLIYLAKKIFNFFIEDPSNINETFKRSRIRKIIKLMHNEGIDKEKVKLTLNNLTNADDAIKYYVEKNLKKNSKYFEKKNYFLLNHEFFLQPREVVLRSISCILKIVGKNLQLTRGKKIVKLIDNIEKNRINKITLSGCIIEKMQNLVKICPENPKKN